MRTRAQKRKLMPELVNQWQQRLHTLEEVPTDIQVTTPTTGGTAAASTAPANLSASKKRKIEAFSSPPLLFTLHLSKPRLPTINALETSEKAAKIESSVSQRVTRKRTLQHKPPASPEPIDGLQVVLQRICSGQMFQADSSIVGRVQERQAIREALKGGEVQGGGLFIIGPPGTGKSSSVSELLVEQGFEMVGNDTMTLNHNQAKKSIKAAVKLNCSMFTDPVALYAAVAHQVKKATSWIVPEQLDPFEMDEFIALHCRSSRSTKQIIVVVLDEVDQLLRLPARMQPMVKEVLRFLVWWAAAVPRDVKFLGIMNGVNMYQQISRIHVTRESAIDSHVPRVVFRPYSHQDLLLIMQSYVQSALPSKMDVEEVPKFIQPRAIELIARKVAARDGDARLAISLLQQSARHALQRFSSSATILAAGAHGKVTMRDVFQCVRSVLSSPVVQQIQQLPRQAKLLLYVITALAPTCSGNGDHNSTKGPLQHCDMNTVKRS